LKYFNGLGDLKFEICHSLGNRDGADAVRAVLHAMSLRGIGRALVNAQQTAY
jgi:hypothetical protein